MVNEEWHRAVALFNDCQFQEFQDALDAMTSHTRATSERQFYTLLKNVAEAMLQLSDGDVEDAVALLGPALRKLDTYVPRFRGLNVSALRDDLQRLFLELREVRTGARTEIAPSKLPRLRLLPQ